jgi:predicted N-acetyltransferase YhbS
MGIAICFVGFSTFLARPLINIHDLAVLPTYRGQGVGRRLLEQVATKGKALGCCMLTLEVRADNYPAQRLYEAAGFDNTASYGGAVQVMVPGEAALTRCPFHKFCTSLWRLGARDDGGSLGLCGVPY